MLKVVGLTLFLVWGSAVTAAPIAIVIHGGAGTILKTSMTPEIEAAYRDALKTSVERGYAVLKAGGSSREAVIAAITLMEDSPLFNAGKGAVFTHEGRVEMDASIMDGHDLNAGAEPVIRFYLPMRFLSTLLM